MSRKFILLSFIIIWAALVACNQNKTIPIKAAIIYKMGGAQPVARTKFYLLKEDLKVINDSKDKIGYRTPLLTKSLNLVLYRSVQAGIIEEGIREFIVQTTTTDFEGNGQFIDVPPGNYYIAGFTTTRSDSGYLVWSAKVDTEKNNETVLFDQNNAFDSSN